MTQKLHGVIPAMVTPRDDAHDDVDYTRLTSLVKYLLDTGVHALFPTSSTGEAPLLSLGQRQRVIETCVETAAGQVPVLASAGAASTAESIRLAKMAEAAGATHVAILPLHFVRLSDSELFAYFATVSDSVSIPTLLYNYPARTSGQNISPSVAAKLARNHNVIGIKDSSGDMTNSLAYLAECPEGFAVFNGFESLTYPMLAMGGSGTICAAANLWPRLLVSLYDAYQAGDHARARECQETLLSLRPVAQMGTFPAGVKAAMAVIGQPVGGPFLPAQCLSDEQKAEIDKMVQKIGQEKIIPDLT